MNSSSIQIAGKRTLLGKPLGRGGEGDVYALIDRTDLAVKVYKEALRRSREAKVRAMVESHLADKTELVAFPSAIATDGAGTFAGFTMRLVSGYRPIHELYSPKSRKIQFPKADYRFLVQVAQNVARAVATVHQAGCIIGDFNHSGVLVASNATVALIDADSFQFELNGHSFPCVVGTEDFTPPELHGKNLGQIRRTQAHDNFGLAVAIFQLLAMGKHPYMGRYSGGDLSLGQAIAQHRFAYSITRHDTTRTTPPPASIQLSDFPRPVEQAFEAAFGLDPARRPDPAAWIQLLEELKTSLRRCSSVPTHYFPHTAQSCIWCRIAGQSGVEMFPPGIDFWTSARPAAASGPFDLGKIAAAIRAIPFPRPDDILPTWTGDPGPPLPVFKQAKSKRTNSRWFGGLFLIAALLSLTTGFGGGLLGMGLLAIGLYKLATAKIDASPLLSAYSEADTRVRAASLAHLQRLGFTELFVVRNEMESCISEYQQLEAKLARELTNLKATREARQRHAFLDRCLLSRVKIAGIGPAKLAALASFSIESAADINYDGVMAVPGFGEALTQKLLTWRREQEAKFRYNAMPDPSDRQAEDALRAATAQRRDELQKKLQSGLAALQSAPARLASSTALQAPALMQALADRARAERDCASLGIKVPPHAPLNPPIPRPAPSPAAVTASMHPPAPPPHTTQPAPAPTPVSTSMVTCPLCKAAMIRRKARTGPSAGKYFWGCSRFPQCRGTRN
jgi:DNA-binding helix-hairpin-helix protein with protein kinase domain